VKYATEWSGDISESIIKKDVEKLEKLLKQKDGETGTDHACLLILFRWRKTYKSKHRCKKGEKIKTILKNLKNKKIKTYFYPKTK